MRKAICIHLSVSLYTGPPIHSIAGKIASLFGINLNKVQEELYEVYTIMGRYSVTLYSNHLKQGHLWNLYSNPLK